VKPAGPPKDMGGWSAIQFTKEQQSFYACDVDGKVLDQAKHAAALKLAIDEATCIPVRSRDMWLSMPRIGLGLWKSKPGEVEEAVYCALASGVRLLDGAAAYDNENEVGAGLAKACRDLGVPREEVFVVSKLFNTHHVWNGDVSRVGAALDKSLKDLGVDYLDLYLMHWPFAFEQTDVKSIGGLRLADGTPNPKLVMKLEFIDTYREMIKLLDAGKCRAIGVCNFTQMQLEQLLAEFPEHPPSINQCELHPYLAQKDLLDFCADRGIAMMAYSPLGSGGSYSGKSFPAKGTAAFQNPDAGTTLLQNAVVGEIAQRLGKTPAQVLVRWNVQRGVVCIPKSVKPERIKENASVTDWSLEVGDVARLDSLDCGFRYVFGYQPGHYDCPNAPWFSQTQTSKRPADANAEPVSKRSAGPQPKL